MSLRCVGIVELPEDLAGETDPFVELGLGQVQVADEAAESFFRCWVVAFVDVATAIERFEQNGDEPFALACGGRLLTVDEERGGSGGGRGCGF